MFDAMSTFCRIATPFLVSLLVYLLAVVVTLVTEKNRQVKR